MRIIRAYRLIACSVFIAATGVGQTQSFTIGAWFFGKNVTFELPQGVVDVTDNVWSSSTQTCPILITGSKTAPIAQIACRRDATGARFNTVISENDVRLAGTRLVLPTAASASTGRYLTSIVRPGEKHLYFTSISGTSSATFIHDIAWRYRNYETLERVAGAGDLANLRFTAGASQTVNLSSAGPIDSTPDGREFIYLEAAAFNRYGIYEIKSEGVYEQIYAGRLIFRDSPWGMDGFLSNLGGLVFRQSVVVYDLDPNTKGPTVLAQEGVPFVQTPALPPTHYPNLQVAQFFKATNDPNWFFFNWGLNPGKENPPQVLTWWKDWGWQPYYSNQFGTSNETVVGTLAVGDRVTLLGGGPKGAGTSDYDPNSKVTVPWAFTSLWSRTPNGPWVKILRETALPDSTTSSPKKYYQGVSARSCVADFATKQSDASTDNSGAFYAWYRLYRPCINSAEFQTVTRELVIRGVNLMDQRTEIGIPPPVGTQITEPRGQLLAARITSLTPTEIHATVDSVSTLERVSVLINGQVWSDPSFVVVKAGSAPGFADMFDLNFEYTPAAPNKLMVAWGFFGCTQAAAQTVNYPTSLGNCAIILDNGIRLPLLYTGDNQINFLMPANLALGAHEARVTRQDATGTFTSGPFPFTTSTDFPIAIKSNGNVIIGVVRNGFWTVLGPNDPIRPGEYFTIVTTGGNVDRFPATAKVGDVDAPLAKAVVSWAQGVVQINIQAPNVAFGAVQVRIGNMTPFPVRIQ